MVIIGPAGNAIQMLPPTVAAFHTLNDARNASQLVRNKLPASQPSGGTNSCSSLIVHVAPISRPPASRIRLDPPSSVRSTNQPAGGGVSENSHLPPASHASPVRQAAPGRSDGRRTTSTTVLR